MTNKYKNKISSSIKIYKKLLNEKNLLKIDFLVKKILETFKNKKKIIFCGNGGSAAHAQHMAAEYVSKFKKNRKPLSAISLTTDTSILTSISNDFDYKFIFSKQIEAIGNDGDLLLCYSTSGNSNNVLEAAKVGKKKKIFTVGITGNKKNKLKTITDYYLDSPTNDVAQIQECNLIIDHIICEEVEKILC